MKRSFLSVAVLACLLAGQARAAWPHKNPTEYVQATSKTTKQRFECAVWKSASGATFNCALEPGRKFMPWPPAGVLPGKKWDAGHDLCAQWVARTANGKEVGFVSQCLPITSGGPVA